LALSLSIIILKWHGYVGDNGIQGHGVHCIDDWCISLLRNISRFATNFKVDDVIQNVHLFGEIFSMIYN
jgi:hypothetical protein